MHRKYYISSRSLTMVAQGTLCGEAFYCTDKRYDARASLHSCPVLNGRPGLGLSKAAGVVTVNGRGAIYPLSNFLHPPLVVMGRLLGMKRGETVARGRGGENNRKRCANWNTKIPVFIKLILV